MIGIDFEGHDIRRIKGVSEWFNCGYECNQDPRCLYWTWKTYDHRDDPCECMLKDSDEGYEYDEHHFSGDSNCH